MIKILKELTEYGNNIKEDMKVTLSEIEKNPQGTNSEGKEVGIQINDLEHKEEINIQPEPKEETILQKNESTMILVHLQKWPNTNHRDARRRRRGARY